MNPRVIEVLEVVWDGRRAGPGGASTDTVNPALLAKRVAPPAPIWPRQSRVEIDPEPAPPAPKRRRTEAALLALAARRRKGPGVINRHRIWVALAKPGTAREIANRLDLTIGAVSQMMFLATRAGTVVFERGTTCDGTEARRYRRHAPWATWPTYPTPDEIKARAETHHPTPTTKGE